VTCFTSHLPELIENREMLVTDIEKYDTFDTVSVYSDMVHLLSFAYCSSACSIISDSLRTAAVQTVVISISVSLSQKLHV